MLPQRFVSRSQPTEDRFVARFPELFPIAYTAGYRILGDAGRSEDVAQEALVRAMTRWEKVESYAEPWVSRVATNLAIDEWRRHRADPDDTIDVEVSDDAGRVIDRDELRTALTALPSRQREAIVLRLIEGYGPEEAARAMGIAPAGVLKHTTRALRTLRQQLSAPLPDHPDEVADVRRA